jgi:hypothetical protein
MHQQAQWHALEHFGEWLNRPHDLGAQLPQADDVCAVCALFAGGSTAATSSSAAVPTSVARQASPRHTPSSRTAEAPSFYLSRAPPSLS